MSAHRWKPYYRHGGKPADFMEAQRRRCTVCGAIQELHIEYAWMRQVGRQWVPRVGRCPGKPHANPPKPEWLSP